MYRSFISMLAFTLTPAVVLAQDTPPRPVRATLDVGFVNTAGNTQVTTLNVADRFVYTSAPLVLTQTFSVVYGRTGDSTTTNQWKAAARLEYGFADRIAVFARAGFERNRFAGLSRRFEESLGLAATLLENGGTTLALEVGASLNQQLSTADVTTNFAAARVAVDFRHDLTETAFVTQEIEALPNLGVSDDLRVNSETALTAPISQRIAVKLGYVVRFDNLPEPGFQTTDRLFTAGLQVSF